MDERANGSTEMTALQLSHYRGPMYFCVHREDGWELLKVIKGHGKPYPLYRHGKLVQKCRDATEAKARMRQ